MPLPLTVIRFLRLRGLQRDPGDGDRAPDAVLRDVSGDEIKLHAALDGKTHHLLPHPAVFVVDAKGAIRFAHVNPDYRQRLDPQAILKAARSGANAP